MNIVLAVFCLVEFMHAQPLGLPSPWQTTNIGDATNGYANYFRQDPANQPGGEFQLSGSGSYTYFASDSFRYLFQPIIGDAVLIAKISLCACVRYQQSGHHVSRQSSARRT
jgi:hypothetical protein